jgi:hypothetical protein
MYECLYGYTPFSCDDRHQTKLKILDHHKTLVFPQNEGVAVPSMEALHLMKAILVEKQMRLCSRQYELNDWTRKFKGGKMHYYEADKSHRHYAGIFVFPGDAEDIKRHPFFRGINWDVVHHCTPPYIPRVKDWEDTKYFQEEEPVSDIDSATSADELDMSRILDDPEHSEQGKTTQVSQHQQEGQHIIPSGPLRVPLDEGIAMPKAPLPLSLTNPLYPSKKVGIPPAESTLVEPGAADEHLPIPAPVAVKPLVKKKEKKRPRDIVLRDRVTGPSALETRKLNAFLGYEYRQPMMVKDIVQRALAEDHSKSKARDYRQPNCLLEPEVGTAWVDSVRYSPQ